MTGIRSLAALGAVLATSLLAATAATSAAAPLKPLALTPAQVGAGYRLAPRADATCVSRCVTLDMCGFAFTSEALRTGRFQIDYAKASPAVPVSNELVAYRNDGAKLAIDELNRAASTCPKKAVPSNVQGVGPLTYRVQRLTDRKLLPHYVALKLRVTGTRTARRSIAPSWPSTSSTARCSRASTRSPARPRSPSRSASRCAPPRRAART